MIERNPWRANGTARIEASRHSESRVLRFNDGNDSRRGPRAPRALVIEGNPLQDRRHGTSCGAPGQRAAPTVACRAARLGTVAEHVGGMDRSSHRRDGWTLNDIIAIGRPHIRFRFAAFSIPHAIKCRSRAAGLRLTPGRLAHTQTQARTRRKRFMRFSCENRRRVF